MDDGLQNPSIKKDISIYVFDEGLGFGNGFLLPAGPLRETKKHILNADAIIVIRNKNPRKKFVLPTGIPIFYAENKTVSPYPRGERLFAFAGIGYPKKFFNSLSGVVAKRGFGDHYQYTEKDIADLIESARRKKAKLVTTEKDWVRLPADVREKIKFARLETKIDDRFFDWIQGKLNCAH